MKCKNCGERVVCEYGWWAHYVGPGSNLTRCDPEKSGKPYGLEAEPEDDFTTWEGEGGRPL